MGGGGGVPATELAATDSSDAYTSSVPVFRERPFPPGLACTFRVSELSRVRFMMSKGRKRGPFPPSVDAVKIADPLGHVSFVWMLVRER
jgi:hypothetical protein